ncbi:YoaK family protein [Oceaniserpentilla sp. 4NH20-0058]|uniref:YoaK family protein n=1 Tax=Oceaniserpentilla sp. 4NH20-0058 TaxID=3127660 RepID=UPI0031030099
MNTLPRWIEYGAFTLALLAGTINSIGLLGFQHQAISHLSGTATLLGTQLWALSEISWELFIILASFVFGSMLSGFLLTSTSLKLGRHYDSLLLIEGTLLSLAVYFLNQEANMGHYLASAACGLQNALATQYSGAVIRTTHMTGIFTDLGIMLGSALRREPFDSRKCRLFFWLILGFILGGSLGAFLFHHLHFNALFAPAFLCVLLAIAYRIYWQRTLN